MTAALIGIFIFNSKEMLYICIACIGYGNANIFPVVFSQAMKTMPHHGNEVSGLMIMGIFGGTIFPLLMGIASDFANNQHGAIAVMLLCAFYLLAMSRKVKDWQSSKTISLSINVAGILFYINKVIYFCTIYRYKIYRHRNMSQASQNTKVILLFFRKMATPSLQYRSILIELYLGTMNKLKHELELKTIQLYKKWNWLFSNIKGRSLKTPPHHTILL